MAWIVRTIDVGITNDATCRGTTTGAKGVSFRMGCLARSRSLCARSNTYGHNTKRLSTRAVMDHTARFLRTRATVLGRTRARQFIDMKAAKTSNETRKRKKRCQSVMHLFVTDVFCPSCTMVLIYLQYPGSEVANVAYVPNMLPPI